MKPFEMVPNFLVLHVLTMILVASVWTQNLCPAPDDIQPCTCHEDTTNYSADIDCSSVADTDHLQEIFARDAFMPTNLMSFFSTGSALQQLTPKIFGNVTFRKIIISGSAVQSVDMNALLSMAGSLEEFIAPGSRIKHFPFEILPVMSKLRVLDLSRNNLRKIEKVVSNSLTHVNLQGNIIENIPEDTFLKAVQLVDLKIGGNNFTTLPKGFLQDLKSLRAVDISLGTITILEASSLAFTSKKVKELWLNMNFINEISHLAFDPDGIENTAIHLENNALSQIPEETFKPLFVAFDHSKESTGFLHLDGNPIICDCRIQWLAENTKFLKKVSGRCRDGTPLHSLNASILREVCSKRKPASSEESVPHPDAVYMIKKEQKSASSSEETVTHSDAEDDGTSLRKRSSLRSVPLSEALQRLAPQETRIEINKCVLDDESFEVTTTEDIIPTTRNDRKIKIIPMNGKEHSEFEIPVHPGNHEHDTFNNNPRESEDLSITQQEDDHKNHHSSSESSPTFTANNKRNHHRHFRGESSEEQSKTETIINSDERLTSYLHRRHRFQRATFNNPRQIHEDYSFFDDSNNVATPSLSFDDRSSMRKRNTYPATAHENELMLTTARYYDDDHSELEMPSEQEQSSANGETTEFNDEFMSMNNKKRRNRIKELQENDASHDREDLSHVNTFSTPDNVESIPNSRESTHHDDHSKTESNEVREGPIITTSESTNVEGRPAEVKLLSQDARLNKVQRKFAKELNLRPSHVRHINFLIPEKTK